MSLFQCEHCGCCENTALSGQGCGGFTVKWYDWTGIEDRKGKKLCSACGPTKYKDGTPTEFGEWHGQFPRTFLPMGMFFTNREGNLAHMGTKETNFRKYAIEGPK